MAVLRDAENDLRILLRARHLVGRTPGVDLLIERPEVSREHATIGWTADGWEVRDLGSRNGTWVGDKRLDPGDAVRLLAGDVLRFGSERNRWTLEDASPPELAAVCDGAWVEAEEGLLALPDAEAAELVVHHEPGLGWVVETDGQVHRVRDRERVEAGGRTWELHVPRAAEPTAAWADGRAISQTALRFAVSADEEYVEITAELGGTTHTLPPRAHHYLLLTLARARVEDAAEGGPDSEHGWVYTDELQKMLGATSNQLYVQIHRARKEFEALDLSGAASIVQRRPTTRQVRLGVGELTIGSL